MACEGYSVGPHTASGFSTARPCRVGQLSFQGLSRGDGLLIRLTTRQGERSRDRPCRPGGVVKSTLLPCRTALAMVRRRASRAAILTPAFSSQQTGVEAGVGAAGRQREGASRVSPGRFPPCQGRNLKLRGAVVR